MRAGRTIFFSLRSAWSQSSCPNCFGGRDFVRQELLRPDDVTETSYIDGYAGFKIAEHWLWKDTSTASAQGSDPCFCEVWFNAARNRAFIGYVAD